MITKKKSKGKRTRKRRRKRRRRNWIIKMMVTLRFQQSKLTTIVIPLVLRKRKCFLLKMKRKQMMMFLT
jgi:hypothetical protein